MPRSLNLQPSTSEVYAKFAANVAAETKAKKESLTAECANLYKEVSEKLAKVNIANTIKAQNSEIRNLCELRDVLRQISKDVKQLSKI